MTAANNPKARNRTLGLGAPLPVEWVEDEPTHGSVVLTESFTGTAWQRHYSDGLWHSTTGRVKTWAEVGIRAGQPKFRTLVYTAPDE